MLRRLVVVPVVLALLACCTAASAAAGWRIQPTPNPQGKFNLNDMFSVSCTSASDCVATGSTGEGGGYSELWNGSSWRLQPTARDAGRTPQLIIVSCPAAADCVASTDTNATEHWNGSTWALSPLASPPAAVNSFEITPVSCVSATNCTGYGGYTENRSCTGVAEHWNGKSWTVQSTVPGGCARTRCQQVRDGCGLDSLSCPVASSCMAVGSDVSEFWNGDAWLSEPIASPGGGFLPFLVAVSCTSANSCTAVGNQSTGGSDIKPLAEHWNGTSWAVQAVPNPAGTANAVLSRVSCPSAANCTAVGRYGTTTAVKPLAEHWNGTSWVIQAVPSPAGTSDAELDGVSCPTAAHCTAVGQLFTASGSDTLAEAR